MTSHETFSDSDGEEVSRQPPATSPSTTVQPADAHPPRYPGAAIQGRNQLGLRLRLLVVTFGLQRMTALVTPGLSGLTFIISAVEGCGRRPHRFRLIRQSTGGQQEEMQ